MFLQPRSLGTPYIIPRRCSAPQSGSPGLTRLSCTWGHRTPSHCGLSAGREDTSCEPRWGPRLSEEAENLNSKFPLSQGRLLFEWKSPYYLVPIIYISCPLSQHTELKLHKLNACRI